MKMTTARWVSGIILSLVCMSAWASGPTEEITGWYDSPAHGNATLSIDGSKNALVYLKEGLLRRGRDGKFKKTRRLVELSCEETSASPSGERCTLEFVD